ncbi:YjgF-like protein [Aspergillus uvarum CBS 121591]|uniref:YjgF-like protein n=1 Tax=Aspergillus uvarum CBS 121591 TaxID=1448315 RepID=A0A319BUE5_9EURO|nr:YjgF-like protein [Aspergillus uvarum CBS 121591]PYH76335.1 YjgF-like protein [Aspergillus uvarum CBS 121591]
MSTCAKKPVFTAQAPVPKPSLSQAMVINGFVYTSGAVGMDPSTEELVTGTTADRTIQCLKNISNILDAAGSSLEKTVKVNIFIDDMANYAAMNEGYLQMFTQGTMPVRTCVAVKQLPLGTDVDIEVIAHL